jgi:hypothetical protein
MTTGQGGNMKTGFLVCAVALAVTISSAASAQPPDHFELLQNVPDPFCPSGEVGATDIRFQMPMRSAVLLEVWSADTTAVVRTLLHGLLDAGYHSVIWDGSDDGGADLPSGAYPYSMTATDPDSGDSLFYDMLTATIDCSVDIRPGTWGGIKAGFGK